MKKKMKKNHCIFDEDDVSVFWYSHQTLTNQSVVLSQLFYKCGYVTPKRLWFSTFFFWNSRLPVYKILFRDSGAGVLGCLSPPPPPPPVYGKFAIPFLYWIIVIFFYMKSVVSLLNQKNALRFLLFLLWNRLSIFTKYMVNVFSRPGNLFFL